MKISSKIYVAGHTGLVGSAIMRCLSKNGYNNVIYKSSNELDLRNQADVQHYLENEKPEYIFLAAAKVGGIYANNSYPAQFIYDNLMIQTNIVNMAYLKGVKKLLFLGSSCIYPKFASQPIKEEYLLTGALEETNEAYAIAKIAGLEMCKFYRRQYGCDFISAMPTNLYGINDNFDLETSHVLPALIRKIHEAKIKKLSEVVIWGTGTPKREFLYVDDLADALIFLMNNYSDESHVNIGTGEDIEIRELAEIIKDIINYKGNIVYDTNKPDGTPKKQLDVSLLQRLGWRWKYDIRQGAEIVYNWYLKQDNCLKDI